MAILLPEARYLSGAIIAASRGAVKIPPLDLWDRDARIARRGGAVAQLGERRVRNAKVEGSIPFRSTSPIFYSSKQRLKCRISSAFGDADPTRMRPRAQLLNPKLDREQAGVRTPTRQGQRLLRTCNRPRRRSFAVDWSRPAPATELRSVTSSEQPLTLAGRSSNARLLSV